MKKLLSAVALAAACGISTLPLQAGENARYLVIDLSCGPSAVSYPVKYMATPPNGGFNTTEYKTTKLVLKRVDAGSFIMGEDQSDESHRVTLTNPFYMGIYEVTQRQWELVMGWKGRISAKLYAEYGKGNAYPVYYMFYDAIRGSSNGSKWPSSNAVDSSSFLGKLRARTGLDFDLPTEAQWEYTCRAGTTTRFNYGNSEDGAYMWYESNSGNKAHEVGTKLPNPWGFYDMHGNVWEWCLDRDGRLMYGVDPWGSSSDWWSRRVLRGGSWRYDELCTSSYRHGNSPSPHTYNLPEDFGFRLSLTLPSWFSR